MYFRVHVSKTNDVKSRLDVASGPALFLYVLFGKNKKKVYEMPPLYTYIDMKLETQGGIHITSGT